MSQKREAGKEVEEIVYKVTQVIKMMRKGRFEGSFRMCDRSKPAGF